MAISVQKCKEILKNPELTDQQIEEIRDTLQQAAHVLVQSYLSGNLSIDSEQSNNIIASNHIKTSKRGNK